MANIVDQYHGDPLYTQLHVLMRDYPRARELVKVARFDETKYAVERLPSSAFAWEDERRFPIHTREDTVASLFYRMKCASAVPPYVDAKLTTAAQIYDIDRGVFDAMKIASAKPRNYALAEEKRLPLDNAVQVKKAEEVLLADYSVLGLEKRAEAFRNLWIAARRFQVQLEPTSLKMAGVTGCAPHVTADWLDARAEAATDPKHKAAYEKLASVVKQMPRYVSDRSELVKLASTIAELDSYANLQKHYDRRLPDPLATVFNMDKVAEETCDVAGTQVPVSSLMQIPPEVWQQIDAPEFAELAQGDPAAFAQAFATLPLDLKVALQAHVA